MRAAQHACSENSGVGGMPVADETNIGKVGKTREKHACPCLAPLEVIGGRVAGDTLRPLNPDSSSQQNDCAADFVVC